MSMAKCAVCDKIAACVGRYEDEKELAFACDECCGHGCEDGFCVLLADEDTHARLEAEHELDMAQAKIGELEQENNELVARIQALEDQLLIVRAEMPGGSVH